jgi:hypothetical protein
MTRIHRPMVVPKPDSAVRSGRTGPRRLRWAGWLLLALIFGTRASAQQAPGAYSASPGGRFTFGGEASVSMAQEDYSYFNYSTDAYSVLRLVRLDGSAAMRVGSWLLLVGDLRLQGGIGEGGWQVRPYALFARIRPWRDRPIDIQAGLIPPVFGAFARRAYGTDNPLIGFPLGYQYVTTLRPDAVPPTADVLLAMQGHGWRVQYPVGNPVPDHGVPLMDSLRYPAGIEIHAGGSRVEASAALTTGSLSTPGATDVGWIPQVSGRLAVRPVPGLVLGGSLSRGAFLARSLTDAVGTTGTDGANDQTAAGFDAEYSRGHWIVRAEGIYSQWHLTKSASPFLAEPLGAFAFDVEGRYRVLPGLYAAIRVDRLAFSEVCGSTGCHPWDAPVRRVEAGAGYAIRRNIVVKGAYQYNCRDGTFRSTDGLAAAQLLVLF